MTMNFSQALKVIKKGKRVRRRNWREQKSWIILAKKGETKWIAISKDGMILPWFPSQDDLLSDDWEVIK